MRAPYQHSPASQVHYLSIGLFGQVSAGYCFKQRQAARGASRGRIQLNPSVCPACSATALPQSCWKLSGSCTRGRTWACPYNPPQETTSQATKRDTVKARNILQQSQPPAGLIVMKTAMERERERVTVPLNVPNVLIFSSLNKTVAPFNPLQTLLGRPAMPWLLRCIGVAFTAGQTVGPYDLVAVQLLEEAPGAKLRQFGMSCCWWNWRHTS